MLAEVPRWFPELVFAVVCGLIAWAVFDRDDSDGR